MKEASGTLIPIRLVIDKGIPLIESNNLVSLLCQKLTALVVEYLVLLGIEGSPEVQVQPTKETDRVMQVFVHGIRQPYSRETMRRVWQSNVSQHLRDLPDRVGITYHFPDGWLNEYLDALDHTGQEEMDRFIDFLSGLAFAAIQEKPSCLISTSQVLRYIGRDGGPFQIDADFTGSVLTFLLDQGVSVADVGTILRAIRQCYTLGQSSEDTSELLFARLRCPVLELIVAPEEFRNVTDSEVASDVIPVYSDVASQALRELMNTMEEGLFWEIGLYVPDLVWKIDPNMPPGLIAFKTNDRTTQCIPLLAQDELLVNDTPDRLELLNVTAATTTANPANDKPCSVVSVAHKALLESAGLTTWDRLGYLVLLTAGEIKRRAPQLFSVDDAAYHLEQIRAYFPVLVEQVLKRFSIETVTRVLRALLAERISIRDLWSILERLLQYDTITVDANRLIVFDERLPIAPGSTVLRPDSWRSYYEFLRSGLKRQITSGLLQGRSTIPVYLLDPKLEEWLIEKNSSTQEALQELDERRHAIRQAILAEIGPNAGLTPIILTTREPRASLQEIIGREMPNVVVVAYSELVPDVSLQPISRIAVPEYNQGL